jgi:hypothetical protein
MLDELDARILFLPQLEMAIDGRRDDKVRAVFVITFQRSVMSLYSRCEEVEQRRRIDAPCNDCKVNHVTMHETLVISVCPRQMVQEESFMRENYKEVDLLSTIVLNLA